MSQPRLHRVFAAIVALAALLPAAAADRSADGARTIPHVNDRARQGYREYLQAEMHRAYAIAPGGVWTWKSGFDSPDEAIEAAVGACQVHTEQNCVPYAVNDEVVFDARRWIALWGPYRTAAEAARAPEGRGRGERFPDLLFTDAGGRPVALSNLRGKVVLVHLWGTWCPSCVHEMPQFEELVMALRDVPDVVFVFSQVREPYDVARGWLQQQGVRVPLYDSGSHQPQDNRLKLKGGGTLADRAVAPVFPMTYVLDRHGLVVFSLRGSASDWLEYTEFLRDVAARSK